MDKTISEQPTKNSFNDMVIELFGGYLKTREISFTEQLNKLQN
jgi:hypothetical protein